MNYPQVNLDDRRCIIANIKTKMQEYKDDITNISTVMMAIEIGECPYCHSKLQGIDCLQCKIHFDNLYQTRRDYKDKLKTLQTMYKNTSYKY